MQWFLLALAVWNIAVFAVYGIDKAKAVRGSWRISEVCLLVLALLFGGIGGMLGMLVFRHKIRKPKFFTVYVLAAIESIVIVLLCVYVF